MTTTGKVDQGQIPRLSFKKMEEEDDVMLRWEMSFMRSLTMPNSMSSIWYASRNNEDE